MKHPTMSDKFDLITENSDIRIISHRIEDNYI